MISRLVRRGVEGVGRRFGTGLRRRFCISRTHSNSYSLDETSKQHVLTEVDMYLMPFGSPFIVVPLPPSNSKTKIAMIDTMTVDILAKLIIYRMPQSKVTVTDLLTGE